MIGQIRRSWKRLALGLLLMGSLTFIVVVKPVLLDTMLAYLVFVGVAAAPILLAEWLLRASLR